MQEMNGRTRVGSGIAAVIFDWAGTIVDFGCFAPTVSIVETFARRGVTVTLAEARGPMGLEKREHLWCLLAEERIRGQWKAATGADPAPADADSLYEDLEPRLVQAVKSHSALIPGTKARLAGAERRLRKAGAHYVTESVGTCRAVLAGIEERIIRGEHPSPANSHELKGSASKISQWGRTV